MRHFNFITVGKVLEKLKVEGIEISRPTFMKLMKEEKLFQMRKTANGWWVCSPQEMILIVQLIKHNYQQHIA